MSRAAVSKEQSEKGCRTKITSVLLHDSFYK